MGRKMRWVWLPAEMAKYLAWQFFPAWMQLRATQKNSEPQDDEFAHYQEEVLRCLADLLYFHPSRDHILKNYLSDVGDAIKRLYSEKSSPQYTALLGAESIFLSSIDNLCADQRKVILQELKETTQGQLADILKGSKAHDHVMSGTLMIGYALVSAGVLVDRQQIEASQFESFKSDVLGALRNG